jgi:hypothetical protein
MRHADRHLIRRFVREAVARHLTEAAGDKCLNCGSPKEEGDRFCGDCGCNVSEECVGIRCDAHVEVSEDYCGECGSPQFRRDPEAREHIRQKMKLKNNIKLREKIWKESGGKSSADDIADADKLLDDYMQALENRVAARISRDPKFNEIDQKFKQMQGEFRKYLRDHVTTAQKYYTGLVKAGIATDKDKEAAEYFAKRAKSRPNSA